MSNKLKFHRVQALPEQGEIGSLYFVYGEAQPSLYICTEETTFESYTVKEYVESELVDNLDKPYVEEDTLHLISQDAGHVEYNTLRLKSAFAEVQGDTLILK